MYLLKTQKIQIKSTNTFCNQELSKYHFYQRSIQRGNIDL